MIDYPAHVGGEPLDVAPLVGWLDRIHAGRPDRDQPLRVVVPAAGSQPEAAILTLVEHARRWGGVQVLGMHYTRVYDPAGAPIKFYSPYMAGPDREMYNRCVLDVIDRSFARIGRHYQALRPHAIITEGRYCDGRVSMGASADYTHRLITETDVPVFVVLNEWQPFIAGNLIPDARITGAMGHDHPVHEAGHAGEPTGIQHTLAANVADLLGDLGDDLAVQIGVGAIPDLIVDNARDLIGRVWSEVITPSMRRLPAGTPITGTLVLGDRALYEWADGNPDVTVTDVERTNDAHMAEVLGLVSIIQAMEVTLSGETVVGVGRRYSGPGGAPDFGQAAGATHIIVLPSIRCNGAMATSSNIVVGAGPRDHLVLAASDHPQYVVTEWGVARLDPHVREDGSVFVGSAEDVARALITIAHPRHRWSLFDQAAAFGVVKPRREGRAA